MSPKAKAEAKAAKVEKKTAKAGKAPKAGKAAKGADEAAPVDGAPAVDLDELEEAEDMAAAAKSGGGGSSEALAAAAASGSTEMSASFKNYRHHPDMENFYRFIYENDLRHEALAIIDEITIQKQARKAVKGARANAH